MRENIRALGVLMKREIRMLAGHRIYWFVMIFAPLFCFLFFMALMKYNLHIVPPHNDYPKPNLFNQVNIVKMLILPVNMQKKVIYH